MKTLALLLLLFPAFLSANQLRVCSDCNYTSISSAANDALPGDTILVIGTMTKGDQISELRGKPNDWIYIIGENNANYGGGNTGIQLSDCEYLNISNITIKGQLSNGVNIDDAGSFDTPTHHIKIDNCTFRDIAGTGNNDLLKLSGFDDFEITNCNFINGSPGGSGIDMVGCHNGLIANNYFENMGSNSIQAKGGTSDIKITRNMFINGGNRAINLGGSTGLAYFRPQVAKTESQDISVFSNIFVGGECAVAFVGTVNSHVYNNTMIGSRKWVFRILQETVDTYRFISCGDNSFYNNAILLDDSLSMTVNIGSNTRPESFEFSNNLWYQINNKSWNHNLPSNEQNSIIGTDPELSNKFGYNIYPSKSSILVGKGKKLNQSTLDYDSISFANFPTIGAFELNPVTTVANTSKVEYKILTDGTINLNSNYYTSYRLYNYTGSLLEVSDINSDIINLEQIKENYIFMVLESKNSRKVMIIRK